MKRIFLYMLLPVYAAAVLSCHSRSIPQHAVLNHETTDSQGNLVLLGKCTKERLQQAPFDRWFVKNYDDYRVDSTTADQLRPKLAGKRLTIFMGTWCGDSQREVPRMFKILDYCGVTAKSLDLILLNESDSAYKQSPDHEERGLYIFRVPDLLVFDGRKALGRIIESPVVSLEKDLLAILNGDPYTPQYSGVLFLIDQFRERKMAEIRNDLPALAEQVRPMMKYPGELKSFAHWLQTAGEKDQARLVLEINALIFPK